MFVDQMSVSKATQGQQDMQATRLVKGEIFLSIQHQTLEAVLKKSNKGPSLNYIVWTFKVSPQVELAILLN
jgi:hypothetical protein